MILVTGGAGFIGSNFILHWLRHKSEAVVNIDKLTYASNLAILSSLKSSPTYTFIQGDIANKELVQHVLKQFHPSAIIHFAAETHVDRAIDKPEDFIQTNIVGSFCLLNMVYRYWQALVSSEQDKFRFLHVSTDEVYGSLTQSDVPLTEKARYAPSNPYAATKASSDHLVNAWYKTYGLPILVSHASNNYGAFQHIEKLIPATIMRLSQNQPALIYGDGQYSRDWLYVIDHCRALEYVLIHGKIGETYAIAGGNEKTNLEVVDAIYDALSSLKFMSPVPKIEFVKDRLGHDRRYAMDTTKIRCLGWQPCEDFADGIFKTVSWYLSHPSWGTKIG
jgi:dTDP-glucose 4,6-dehydratase